MIKFLNNKKYIEAHSIEKYNIISKEGCHYEET